MYTLTWPDMSSYTNSEVLFDLDIWVTVKFDTTTIESPCSVSCYWTPHLESLSGTNTLQEGNFKITYVHYDLTLGPG